MRRATPVSRTLPQALHDLDARCRARTDAESHGPAELVALVAVVAALGRPTRSGYGQPLSRSGSLGRCRSLRRWLLSRGLLGRWLLCRGLLSRRRLSCGLLGRWLVRLLPTLIG